MNDQGKAYLYGLGAVACWSTVATAFKISLTYLSPAQLVLYSALTAWAFLGVTLLLQGKLHLVTSYGPADYLRSALLGMLNPFLYYLVLFQAYALLPAQEAQAINYTWALTMTLLAVPILGHRLVPRDLIAAVVCYLGVLVIATRGQLLTLEFANAAGVSWALFSTLLWALYWLFNTKDAHDPVTGLFLNFSFALPPLMIYCLWQGALTAVPRAGVAAAVYVGIFEMGLAFVLWLHAMKFTRSTAKISNLIFISPFLSLVLISLVLRERILPSTVAGLAMILVGLVLQQLDLRRALRLPRVK
jgi:drug/metabolite transporter (DMT)-like permease